MGPEQRRRGERWGGLRCGGGACGRKDSEGAGAEDHFFFLQANTHDAVWAG